MKKILPTTTTSITMDNIGAANPLEAYYHVFQDEKHTNETDEDYQERLVIKDLFIKQLHDEGFTPTTYLAALQQRYAQ